MSDLNPRRAQRPHHWAARGLGLAIASVPVLLYLDPATGGERLAVEPLLVHVGLSVPLIAVLALAWVRPSQGAAAYAILGVAYGVIVATQAGLTAAIGLAAPLLLTSLLFSRLNWGGLGRRQVDVG